MPSFFIGLMSGTSLDGVDGVIADLSPDAPSLVRAAAGEPFDPDFKAELLSLNSTGPNELHRAALAANQLAGVYDVWLSVCCKLPRFKAFIAKTSLP